LIREGTDTIFGYPGGYVLDIFDEIYKASDNVRQVLTCHEQGAAHAADGYARATGKTGVVIATSGPGATNLVTGLAAAYMDSVPLVAVTGNVAMPLIGRDSFQEVDITGVTMPVTKHNYIIRRASDISATVAEACWLARSGRPGPVLIDIPKDFQQEDCPYIVPPAREALSVQPDNAELAEAARLINAAQKPLIYTGGGVGISGASRELIELAEKINSPVASTLMGLGAFPASHPLYAGMIGMHGHAAAARALAEADLILAVGVRFSDRVIGDGNSFGRGKKIIHIDIDDAEINKNVACDCGINADARAALAALLPLVNRVERAQRRNAASVARAEKNPARESTDAADPRAILRAIGRCSGDCVIATDVGLHQIWAAREIGFDQSRRFLTSGGLGAMGYGMGAAIGAAVGTETGRAVLVTGDGSFHMNFNEVVTAVANNLKITVFLFNNNTLGMVRRWQNQLYDGRYSSTTLNRPTDYRKLAQAFGAGYLEIDKDAGVDETVKQALNARRTMIVNCKIDIDEK